jgi:hypothetical protein
MVHQKNTGHGNHEDIREKAEHISSRYLMLTVTNEKSTLCVQVKNKTLSILECMLIYD